MEIKNAMGERIKLIDEGLDFFLPREDVYPGIIYEAMRYSVFAGGKRLRPLLLLGACEAVGGDIGDALPFACAIEAIHTYSLIHDDLPAMDNDDYRRGRLTSHKVFGENIAVLAGDALLSLGFEIMTGAVLKKPEFIPAMREICIGCGARGMIAGQTADVINEGMRLGADMLSFIHKKKTGAMITAAMAAGGIIGGGTGDDVAALKSAGEKIGLAFQIQDDILDITGTQEELGKPAKSDERNHKTTYATYYGPEKSKTMAAEAFSEALGFLKNLKKPEFLLELAVYISKRTF